MYFSSCTLSGPTLWTGTGSTRWSSIPLPPLNAPGGKRRGGTNHDLGSRPCPESPSAIVPSRREMGRPSGLGIGHLEQQAPGPVGMDDSPAGPSSMPPRRQPASPHSSGGLSSPPGTEDAGALPAYRLSSDWKESYGHPIVFVAPSPNPREIGKSRMLCVPWLAPSSASSSVLCDKDVLLLPPSHPGYLCFSRKKGRHR